MKRASRLLMMAGAVWGLPLAGLAQSAELSCRNIAETRDPCLVGTWVMTDRAKERVETRFAKFMFAQLRASGGKITSVKYKAPVASLSADGGWTVDHPLSIAGTGSDGGVTYSMKIDLKVNRDSGQWASDGRTLLMCPQGGEQSGTMTLNIPGVGDHTVPMNSVARDEKLQSGRAAYGCSGSTLVLTTEPSEWLESLKLTFKRRAP